MSEAPPRNRPAGTKKTSEDLGRLSGSTALTEREMFQISGNTLIKPRRLADFQGESNPFQAERSEAKRP